MAAPAKITVVADTQHAVKGIKQVEIQLDKMNQAGGRGSMGGRGPQGRGAGQGMLQLAQFADDAQYGIRGILNNIPGVAMGFGASAAAAGALSIVVLGLAKIMDGSARRWGEEWYDNFSDAGKKLKEMNRESEIAAERLSNQIRQQKSDYLSLYEMRRANEREILKFNERNNELQERSMQIRGRLESEGRTRREMEFQGVFSNRAAQIEDPENLDKRLILEEKYAQFKKNSISDAAESEAKIARQRLTNAEQEISIRRQALEESIAAEMELAKITGEAMDESVLKQKEKTKALQEELQSAQHARDLTKQDLNEIEAMTAERLKTAELERKLRLDAIGQELRMKAEQEMMDALDSAGRGAMSVGTDLQRVGLGKTPELVMQVDIAKRSERHLADIAKAVKKLNLGLN